MINAYPKCRTTTGRLEERERGGGSQEGKRDMKQARRFVNVTAIDTAVFRLKL